MTNAPEGAFKIPNFIDQLELAKFGDNLKAGFLLVHDSVKLSSVLFL